MPGLFRQLKHTRDFESAQIDDARFILNGELGKVNARRNSFLRQNGTGRAFFAYRL